MHWSNAVQEQLSQLPKQIEMNEALFQRLYSLVDLTSLNDDDTEETITNTCQKAVANLGHVAAVCVYPKFARLVAAELEGTSVKVACVANFPGGDEILDKVLIELGAAIQDGANEIDVVFPYERYLAGEQQYAKQFVQACKYACGDAVKLKVILETGALGDITLIADAAFDVLAAGADFIKTSTGKMAQGATLEAAATMLLVVKHVVKQVNKPVGFKVSGGIRSIEQAAQYTALADIIMGKDWVTSGTFRIGASRLVDTLLTKVREV